jgi:hypothetical protein
MWNIFHSRLQQLLKVYNECRALDPKRILEETTLEKKRLTFVLYAVTNGEGYVFINYLFNKSVISTDHIV